MSKKPIKSTSKASGNNNKTYSKNKSRKPRSRAGRANRRILDETEITGIRRQEKDLYEFEKTLTQFLESDDILADDGFPLYE